eukprot:16338_1
MRKSGTKYFLHSIVNSQCICFIEYILKVFFEFGAIRECQKELRKPEIKCNLMNNDNELLPDYQHKKTPSIPIVNRMHNSHSYSNPKLGHMSAIQKSSSYPSQP